MEYRYQKISIKDRFFVVHPPKEAGERRDEADEAPRVGFVPTGNSFVDNMLQQFCDFGLIKLKEVAWNLGVTYEELLYAVKALTDASLLEWRNACLRLYVGALLKETDWPVEKVAKWLRFANPRSFCDYCRHEFRDSPFQIRRQYRRQTEVRNQQSGGH